MTAIKHHEEKRTFAKMIPPLLIGTLGVFGVAALYALNLGFRRIEFTPLLIIACSLALGYSRGIVRGALTLVILYFSSTAAALFYRGASPFMNSMLEIMSFNMDASVDDRAPPGSRAFTFAFLMVVVWIILELVSKAAFQTPNLPQLGILDKLGGVFIHLFVGILAASLLFNVAGFGPSRARHNQAYLREPFNTVIYVLYSAQSFWFKSPPPIYMYDINARLI